MNEDRHIFYRAGREAYRLSWSYGLALCVMWYGVSRLILNLARSDPFFRYFGIILCCVSCCLFLIGILSLIFSKMIYAKIRSHGITVRTGILGFRKTNHIEWKDVEYVAIKEKKSVSYFIGTYSGMGLGERPADVLLFHLKSALSKNGLSNINSLSTAYGPNIHHIRVSDDGSEIWLTQPPGGGFEALFNEISKYVRVKSIVATSPKRFRRFLAVLDMVLFGLVSGFFYLVSTNKIFLW